MLRNLKRKMKEKKGQIGEILVVVVLIILAVLGVVKFIMPMFDKNVALKDTATRNLDNLIDTAKVTYKKGDKVTGGTIVNLINYNAKFTDTNDPTISITWTNKPSGGDDNSSITPPDTYNPDNFGASDKIDEVANYYVTDVTYYGSGDLETIEFEED